MTMSLLSTIPGQTGSHAGATSRHKAESRHLAVVLFNDAKQRLLDINNWGRLCGNEGAEFRLTDAKGELLPDSVPVVGNLIRIKLPASTHKKGFSWLKIEKFEQSKDLLKDEELFGFCVKPVKDPSGHFDRNAGSTINDEYNSFLIYRTGCLLTAVEYDVNEMTSVSSVSLLNRLKAQAIAVWSMTGLVRPQWKKLLNGIIKPTFTYA
jgi:hypothetical protein